VNDAEFRRRAHALLGRAIVMEHGASHAASENQRELLAAGPSSSVLDLSAGLSAVNLCCPCCGGSGPPCPPERDGCCVRRARELVAGRGVVARAERRMHLLRRSPRGLVPAGDEGAAALRADDADGARHDGRRQGVTRPVGTLVFLPTGCGHKGCTWRATGLHVVTGDAAADQADVLRTNRSLRRRARAHLRKAHGLAPRARTRRVYLFHMIDQPKCDVHGRGCHGGGTPPPCRAQDGMNWPSFPRRRRAVSR